MRVRARREGDAKRLLRLREGALAEGRVPNPRVKKTRFEDLPHLYIQDYELQRRKSLRDARRIAGRLTRALRDSRASEVTSDRILA